MKFLKFLLFFPILIFYSGFSFGWWNSSGQNSYHGASHYRHSPSNVCYTSTVSTEPKRTYSTHTARRKMERIIRELDNDKADLKKEMKRSVVELRKSLKKEDGVFLKGDGTTSESRRDVANGIRDYMKSKKNGWDCEDTTSFMFHYPEFFNILAEALLPTASADTQAECKEKNGTWNPRTQKCNPKVGLRTVPTKPDPEVGGDIGVNNPVVITKDAPADAQTEGPVSEAEAKNLEKTVAVDAAIAKAREACKEKDDTWHWNGIKCEQIDKAEIGQQK